MRTTEMVLFAPFLKTSKFIPACISIYILSLTNTEILMYNIFIQYTPSVLVITQ